MNTDRPALIAGIAADPENDLRRLVLADWLEEHGEPDRAEFIRLQIEASQSSEFEGRSENRRRLEFLFQSYGQDWFFPCFRALDPRRELALTNSSSFALIDPQRGAYCTWMTVVRGFVQLLQLDLASLPKGSSIGAALSLEPATELVASLGADREHWKRFSEPSLRHLSKLTIQETRASVGDWPTGCLPVFNDSHLPAVRCFCLQVLTADRQSSIPIPPATVRAFQSSPLGYRVSHLTLELDDAGLRMLARSEFLQLDQLTVSGQITREGIRGLTHAPFAPKLRSLCVNALLTDDAVLVLASAESFTKLVELDLSKNRLTDAGLRVLSAARFLPQLERLDLSSNTFVVAEDTQGLSALADALNPDALRYFGFQRNGYDHVPACLNRFHQHVDLGGHGRPNAR